MKAFCSFCGVHFIQDFDKTLLPNCNYWGDLGLGNIDVESKKKLWDWIFQLPADEVFIKNGVGVSISVRGAPVDKEKTFEAKVTNWNEMTEEEQQEFERNYFKGKIPDQGIPITYGQQPTKKD